METWMKEIPCSTEWLDVELIDKGWSADKKYKIMTPDGEVLLRVFSQDKLDNKKIEFDFIQSTWNQGVTCSEPLAFGPVPNDDTYGYMLLSYIEGEDLADVLPELSIQEQYEYGIAAGKVLRTIHEIPVPEALDNITHLQELRDKKIRQLNRFKDASYDFPYQQEVIDYVEANIDEILKQTVVSQHGDYHPGNIIMQPDGEIGIIDFNRRDYGDPFEEFLKIELFTVESSEAFSLGQIDGYFNGDVPDEFWKMLKVYALHSSVYSIVWAEGFSQQDVDGMIERYYRIYDDYKQSENDIPVWVNKVRKEL